MFGFFNDNKNVRGGGGSSNTFDPRNNNTTGESVMFEPVLTASERAKEEAAEAAITGYSYNPSMRGSNGHGAYHHHHNLQIQKEQQQQQKEQEKRLDRLYFWKCFIWTLMVVLVICVVITFHAMSSTDEDASQESTPSFFAASTSRSSSSSSSSRSKTSTRGSYSSSSSSSSTSNSNENTIVFRETPPLPSPAPRAHREENRRVYFGVDLWETGIPRQADNSEYPLLDPPISVADPYGWLRHSPTHENENNEEDASNNDSEMNPNILEYLKAENDYTNAYFNPPNGDASEEKNDSTTTTTSTSSSSMTKIQWLQQDIVEDLKAYMQETFFTLPQLDESGKYYYYQRTMKGQSYPLHCRAPNNNNSNNKNDDGSFLQSHLKAWDGTPEMPILPNEQVYLDENVLATQLAAEQNEQDGGGDGTSTTTNTVSHLDIGDLTSTSTTATTTSDGTSKNEWLAYTVDTTGYEEYELRIQNLNTQEILLKGRDFGLDAIGSSVIWGRAIEVSEQGDNNDESHSEQFPPLFLVKDDDTNRAYQIHKCEITILKDDAPKTANSHHKNNKNNNKNKMNGSIACEVIFEEPDVEFSVGIGKTMDGEYLLVYTVSKITSETHALRLKTSPGEEPPSLFVIEPKRTGVIYEVDHGHGYWWMISNMYSPDNNLFFAPVGTQDKWEIVLNPPLDGSMEASSPSMQPPLLDSLVVLENHIILTGRERPFGVTQLWIVKLKKTTTTVETGTEGGEGAQQQDQGPRTIESIVPLLDHSSFIGRDIGPAHSISLISSGSGSFNTSSILVEYESLTIPIHYFHVDLNANEYKLPDMNKENSDGKGMVLLYERPVPGYDKTKYGCQRILVPSREGEDKDGNGTGEVVLIPVSIAYKTSVMGQAIQKKAVPMHLYGYGSYGIALDDYFSVTRLSLLDRGFLYATANVRGGGELGQRWYDDGKLFTKKHTFHDFIDVGRYFINVKKWTTSDLLSCEGRSAGGLLIGASVNEDPTVFRAAILGVPFLDVLVTMSDATIPLTTIEWSEWGNPNEEIYFNYMRSYSPINNIRSDAVYPSMLILAGLNDPRVAYWEPAKYTATLRYTLSRQQQQNRPIFLHTEMASGHGGSSDRYEKLESIAREQAFLIDQLNAY